MSISTLESPASRAALAEQHANSDRIDAAEHGVRDEIRAAFCMLGVVPSTSIALPAVDHLRQRVGSRTLREAVLELVQDGQVDDELMALLECTDAARLAALQDALQKKLRDLYIERSAADVAAYRE